jgi:beta-glucanase (GH16 family)
MKITMCKLKSSFSIAALGLTALLSACGGQSATDAPTKTAASVSFPPTSGAVDSSAGAPANAVQSPSATAKASSGPYGQNASDYALTYIDDFETGLDINSWSDHTSSESSNKTVNYAVENGVLKIWPQRDTTGQFFNRSITSDGHFSQAYGYFEIDAKLPKGIGTSPMFSLFNHINDARPEIDIMKAAPGAGKAWGAPGKNGVLAPVSFGSAIYSDANNLAWNNAVATNDLSASFHKYGLKWESSKLSFYFDGNLVYSDTINMSTPMFLSLNLWFGGISGAPTQLTPEGKSNAYEIRYVKAWKEAPPLARMAASVTTSSTWTRCATEGGTCTFTGTRQVRYGAGTTFFYKTATGSIACNNATFGDPLPTLAKNCDYVADTATAPAPTDGWTRCATEGGICTFSGTRQVRYGAGTTFFYKTATGSISCTNAVFGDPLPGQAKNCDFGASTTDTWTRCATEGGTCVFSGTRQVRYGAGTTYFYKTATGSIACTNAVFGDPLPGQVKNCDFGASTTTTPPPPTDGWTRCATEGGTCTFSGTRQVRYGAGTTYFYKTATGSIACTNAVFGDPLPTLAKNCDYASTTSTVPTPTTSPGGAPAQAQAAGFNSLVFGDEFDQLNISPDGSATAKWYNGIWYESPSPASRFTLNSGAMTATVLASDPHEAWLTTLNRGGGQSTLFNLGYFEARMKWNIVPDNFSAFWLESSEHALSNANLFCELDIFEAYQNNVFVGTVHDWNWPNNTQNTNNWHPVSADLSQWHTYGVLWTTDTITWYLDNQPLMSAPTPNVCKTQKLFLILGAQARSHDNNVNLDVDWVHVYR